MIYLHYFQNIYSYIYFGRLTCEYNHSFLMLKIWLIWSYDVIDVSLSCLINAFVRVKMWENLSRVSHKTLPACSATENSLNWNFACSKFWVEHSGSVVECLTRDRGVVGSSLTVDTTLCPWAKCFILCLVLVQSRKTWPDMSEKVLTGK